MVDRVRRLERRDDALLGAHGLEALERLLVVDSNVGGAAGVLEPRVLRPDAWVVESGRDGVGLVDLSSGVVLQQVGARAVEHARRAARERRRVPLGVHAVAAGLDAHQRNLLVRDEGVEHADGVGSAADARDDRVGQPANLLEHLRTRLLADDGLEVAHDGGEGVGPDGRSDEVVRGGDVGHPVAHRLVDRVLERRRARAHWVHRRAQHLHSEDVERLPLHVLGAHVNDALETEQRAHRGGGDAVLSGARLGDDALLSEAQREQALADGVVDLVRAGEGELLALEPNLRAAAVLGQTLRVVERRRPANVLGAHLLHLRLEGGVGLCGGVCLLELAVRLDERLGHVPPAESAEVRLSRRDHLLASRALAVLRQGVELALLGVDVHLDEPGNEAGDGVGGALHVGGVVDRLANGRANDHAVGNRTNLRDLCGGGDAEADCERERGVLAHAADEVAEVDGQRRARARHARKRYAVHERVGHRGELLDAVVG
mmetsp:Transcript_16910/g.33079  ORF Transcript_16910/g.33079 Transcript_16910/m.33079 type:complete len:488 (-) Transcript_16910:324-1787(-)